MQIKIRPESSNDKTAMDMLKYEVTNMVTILNNAGYPLSDDLVTIWIKEYNGNLYPKIEFDINHQELQYDMNLDGTINETHFKLFQKQNNKMVRIDLERKDACPELIRIDSLIKPAYNLE